MPLLAVLINVIFPGYSSGQVKSSGLGLIGEIWNRPLWKQSLLNSVTLALGTATIGTIIGGVLATIRARWDFTAAKLLDMTAGIVNSPILHDSAGLGFVCRLGWTGSSVAGADVGYLVYFQPAGLVFVMSLSKFPLAYLAITAASEWNIRQFGYAARLNGARPFTVWRTVEMPLALPSYVAGWTLVFMDTIGDFGLPAALATVYKFPTLTYSIYSAIYQSPVRFDMAGVLAFYLVLILVLAMTLLMVTLGKSRFDFLNARAVQIEKVRPRKAWLYNLLITIFLFLSLGIPIGTSAAVSLLKQAGGGLSSGNFTLDHYRELFSGQAGDHRSLGYLEGMYHSLIIAACRFIQHADRVCCCLYADIYGVSAKTLASIVLHHIPGGPRRCARDWLYFHMEPEMAGAFRTPFIRNPSLLVIAGIAGAIPYAVRVQLGHSAICPARC